MSQALLGVVFALAASACAPVLGIEDTVRDTSARCTLVPHRVFFADKPTGATTVTVSIPTGEQFAKIASRLGTELDPARGHVLAGMRDCRGMALSDAELAIEAEGDVELTPVAFTVDDSGIALGNKTSDPAHAGLLNVEAPVPLKLSALPTGLEGQASSVGDVKTLAGELAYILLEPNSEADPLTVDPVPMPFDCVPTPEPSLPAGTTSIAITIVVKHGDLLDPTSGTPVSGASVRYCFDEPGPCTTPAEETDSNGEATVDVPVEDDGFDGQIVITGELPGCD